jgi:hypothetical protein
MYNYIWNGYRWQLIPISIGAELSTKVEKEPSSSLIDQIRVILEKGTRDSKGFIDFIGLMNLINFAENNPPSLFWISHLLNGYIHSDNNFSSSGYPIHIDPNVKSILNQVLLILDTRLRQLLSPSSSANSSLQLPIQANRVVNPLFLQR